VDEEAALAQLPEAYAAALRLRARGLSNANIAAELELEPEAVPSLLRLADTKLAALSTKCPPVRPPSQER
jgi:DNA-directed RNA polymerase specialized sigma24 family protein